MAVGRNVVADGRAGQLFHIDFGYILGHDPKPYPPPMKIVREMVEAMGDQVDRFKTYGVEVRCPQGVLWPGD
jgi:phosphatidylinositol kinase/protein kinase (PI-3  family)